MPLRESIVRIEDALQSWEENRFLESVSYHLQGRLTHPGTLTNTWVGPDRTFREFLLTAREGTQLPDEFKSLERAKGGKPSYYDTDAAHILEWTAKSRKVYKLPSNMQLLLTETSLKGLSWSDIQLPFDCFAITLETPMKLLDYELDCFIVTRLKSETNTYSLHVAGMGPNAKPWERMSVASLGAWRKLIREGNTNELSRRLSQRWEYRKTCAPSIMYFSANIDNGPIENEYARFTQKAAQNRPEFAGYAAQSQLVFRLVGGLCQYIISLPTGATYISDKRPFRPGRGIDRNAIVNGAEIATVSNFYTLSRDESAALEIIRKARPGEISAHWRRGYWRRPNGQGHNPNASRTIWVRPTLVRGDSLPERGLPGGGLVTVKKP